MRWVQLPKIHCYVNVSWYEKHSKHFKEENWKAFTNNSCLHISHNWVSLQCLWLVGVSNAVQEQSTDQWGSKALWKPHWDNSNISDHDLAYEKKDYKDQYEYS